MNPYTMVVQDVQGNVVVVTITNNPFEKLKKLQEEAKQHSVITVWETGIKVYEVNV